MNTVRVVGRGECVNTRSVWEQPRFQAAKARGSRQVRIRWRARERRPRAFGPRRCRGSVLASMPAHLARATRLINTATEEWRAPGQAQEHCLPEGRGGDTRPAPGAGSARLSGGGSPWRAGRAGRRRARGRVEGQHRPRHSAPLHGFQHRGHDLDLLLQSRRPVAGLLRERGNARLQPGNPFTQLCHWVSKAA